MVHVATRRIHWSQSCLIYEVTCGNVRSMISLVVEKVERDHRPAVTLSFIVHTDSRSLGPDVPSAKEGIPNGSCQAFAKHVRPSFLKCS
jgi:hypothetical protein